MVSPKLASCEFASNPPLFSKMHHLFLKIRHLSPQTLGFSENSWVLAQKLPLGWGGDGFSRHLVPPLLEVNCSYFAL
jgi:hypothetical protein